VLLRGDMDGLPVTEPTGEPFTSENVGAMHACGHDMHVAGLVGAARLLAARRAELPGSVVFMFQPGEEGDGGAELMIAEGVLEAAGERVVAGYGLHVRRRCAPPVGSRPVPVRCWPLPTGSAPWSTAGVATGPPRGTRPTRCRSRRRSCSRCSRW